MAFKKFSQYVDDKNGDFFVLPNDLDSADVVFLYRSTDDVLVADTHYINSNSYSGYIHCCGTGCPACTYKGGIRKQDKLFIPLFNLTKGVIEFWDRNTRFEQVLQTYVFKNYPNPSEYVFRITRHGEAGDRNTRYEISPIGRNTSYPYDKILSDFNMTLPEGYSKVCKEATVSEVNEMLNSDGPAADLGDYAYTPVPRGSAVSEDMVEAPSVPAPEYGTPPADIPETPSAPPTPDAEELPFDESDSNDPLDNVDF